MSSAPLNNVKSLRKQFCDEHPRKKVLIQTFAATWHFGNLLPWDEIDLRFIQDDLPIVTCQMHDGEDVIPPLGFRLWNRPVVVVRTETARNVSPLTAIRSLPESLIGGAVCMLY